MSLTPIDAAITSHSVITYDVSSMAKEIRPPSDVCAGALLR